MPVDMNYATRSPCESKVIGEYHVVIDLWRAPIGAGVFGVEMFLLADGTLLLNEIAPRPHNSGHYTIEACATSQYEQHLRAILGWPLGDTSLVVGSRYS